MPQIEITAPLSCLDSAGRPANFGWAREAFFAYDRELLRVPRARISASDRYIAYSPSHFFIFEVFDDGVLGCIGVSVIPRRDKTRSTQKYIVPLSLGNLGLPNSSVKTSVKASVGKSSINFAAMETGARIIKVDFPKFGRRRFLRGELVLTPHPGSYTLVTNNPPAKRRPSSRRLSSRSFLVKERTLCFTAEGVMQFGAEEIIFSQGSSWGVLDWRRGVRPSPTASLWAAAGGVLPDGRILGKMGHSERAGRWTHINIPGAKHQRIFESGVSYFA
jgi:hypothetical protein